MFSPRSAFEESSKICHEHACTGIERIDNHLAIYRAGNFDPAIPQILRNAGDSPVTVPNIAG